MESPKKFEVNDYERAEDVFFEKLKAELGENLSCYIVTGSLGRENVVPGWSDIDILIIIKNYDNQTFEAIRSAQTNNASGIHIGVTAYSESEFRRSEIFCDAKHNALLNSYVMAY